MKKQLFLSAALLIAASNLCAQQKAGTFSITPKVGVTVSNFSGKMPVKVSYSVISPLSSGVILPVESLPVTANIGFNKSKNKFGITAGAEAQYQFSNIFGISFGAFYTQQGASYDTKGFSYTGDNGVTININDDLKINMNSITVPILAKVYVWKGLAVKAGVQPEFAVSKKKSGNVSINFPKQAAAGYTIQDIGINTLSLSVPVGLSYEYKNIVSDMRYNIGVTDLRKEGTSGFNSDFSSTSHNRTLSFTVGYKFGL